MRRSIKRLKFVIEVIVLAFLLGAWANLISDKASRWASEDETAGMAERYVQDVPYRRAK